MCTFKGIKMTMSKSQRKYGTEPQPFDDLKTITKMIIVYANIGFDIEKIFENIEIVLPDHVPTKKSKDNKKEKVDYNNIRTKHGTVYRAKYKNRIRGLNDPQEDEKLTNKSTFFRNQASFYLYIGRTVKVMLFKNSIKIPGYRSEKDAEEVINALWKLIQPLGNLGAYKVSGETVDFHVETVLHNIGSTVGYNVDREKLNRLMNRPEYEKYVISSEYEPSSNTNVNIRMPSVRPKNYLCQCIRYPLDSFNYRLSMEENPFYTSKGDNKKQHIIVFSSSAVIVMGRYTESMKEVYEYFIDITKKHRDEIEEKITAPKRSLFEELDDVNETVPVTKRKDPNLPVIKIGMTSVEA